MPTRPGYSLVEVVLSSLIVGGVLVGAINVLGAALQTDRVAAARLDAPELVYPLLAEILALPYEDPEEPGGPIGLETSETNTTRADFDDVDDYDLWDQQPPAYKDGSFVPGGNGWRRLVQIQYFDPATNTPTTTDTGIKLIFIRTISPTGAGLEVGALKSRWGTLQQSPDVDTTVVTSIDAQLQIGGSSIPAVSSTHLKNHAHDQ